MRGMEKGKYFFISQGFAK